MQLLQFDAVIVRRPVPIDRRSLIPRSRVLALLDRWTDARLISIVAPTGYGKSTFTSEWLRTLNGPLPVWLSLEPEIATAPLFAEALGEALLPTIPALAEPLAELRAGRVSPLQFAQTLTAELRRSTRRFVCVLDDYHLVTDPEAHDVVQHIVDHGPENFHLALLSRTQPPLQFSRLLLHGAAIALDERHLRLDHDEFLAFVAASRLAGLSDHQRAEVERRADGWIAALRLIDLSMPHAFLPGSPSGHPSEIDALLGPHSGRLLVDHLKTEVFDRLPNELRAFLVEAAVLPFLDVDLLAAATGHDEPSCERRLAQALRANLFLTAYENESGLRYRIHPLLREMLAQVAVADDERRARAEHVRRRAADWLAARGEVDAALALLLPHHPAAAAALLARGPLRAALLDFDLAAVRRWLALLPASIIDAHPALAIDAAWLTFFAEENGSDHAAARAQHALAAFADDPACAELRVEAAVLQSIGQFLTGQINDALRTADAALKMPCADFGLAAGYLRVLPTLHPDISKHPDDVRRKLRDAEAIFRRIGFAHGAIETAALRAIYAQRIGDAEGACAAFENALDALHFFGRDNSGSAVDLLFFYGDHLYSLNRLAEARTLLERVDAIHARTHLTSPTLYAVALCLQLCGLADDRTSSTPDLTTDAQKWSAVLDAGIISHSARAAWLRLVRDARMNAVERCRRTFDSFGVFPADLTDETHDLVWMASLAGAVLSRAPIDPPTIASRLRELCRRAEDGRNLWIAHNARAILAVHLLESGDEAGARDAVHPLLIRSDRRRLLLDLPPLARFVTADAHPTEPLTEPLTEREREVLRWFATDRTNKEIAHALSISLHTLYTHTQSIYRKLGVHSRKEATQK